MLIKRWGRYGENVFAAALAYKRMIRVYSCKQKTRYFFVLAKNSASFVVFGFG
ncbi:hypothetical protein HMPREF0541_02463 [Lacticaseibacillus rhamnosus ATCC 21052]|nr:hypothetical protein HMPREF0541_02463 [Lacticaseibacillus rhamnosus ATCC 21052]